MKILIGTNNNNKLGQFIKIFGDLDKSLELLSLQDLAIDDDIKEDKDSLLENAKKKARYYGEKTNIPTLADDTGLFIDALNGEPGIHAKRWFDGTEKDRYMKILEKMKDIPREKRTCRYCGVLVFYSPKTKKIWSYEQDLEGIIADSPKEGGGFGYDPIVIVRCYNKYYSELTDEEKFKINHRGLGVRKLLTDIDINRF